MAGTIGIKLANGQFYPIMNESLTVKKRLVLTTAHDYQKSVQIDLYKSPDNTMNGALYIGNLVFNTIAPQAKGGPSIELVIDAAGDGVITAEAFDMADLSGERQQLSLDLKSFEEDTADYSGFSIDEDAGDAETAPEFLLETPEEETVGEVPALTNGEAADKAAEDTNLYAKPDEGEDKEEEEGGIPVLLGIVIILLLLCAGLWFFLFRAAGFPWETRETTTPGTEAPANPGPESGAAPEMQPEPDQPPPPEPSPEASGYDSSAPPPEPANPPDQSPP
jgi:hypothetical protein